MRNGRRYSLDCHAGHSGTHDAFGRRVVHVSFGANANAMKIDVVQVCRRPPWPFWAVLIVLVWMGLGAAAVLLIVHLDRPVELCLIKRCTGVACPTCGFTRGVLSLLHGQICQAWLYNPLLYSLLVVFFSATAIRVIFARSVRINLTSTERIVAWILAVALFFFNWAYVIVYVG